ncbi:hypothetical protein POVWA2_013220 [Plasmodium ovale wallikeri]|uniref:Uncharacterized protein n=2 Tax=Plasmodium ovale TaxID=36330 RepID=A0A1A8YM60_PLAOA|nr:hypothetical protein POVWA1_013000 [Plasmodium ovale wallikeri]SBT33149.1 hypothetical protein POVWA2_013220 [Plasmodium ovale wallikeri]SBT76011.1 conserved Plasmodium protein, unknown function [Plasmodium ovale]
MARSVAKKKKTSNVTTRLNISFPVYKTKNKVTPKMKAQMRPTIGIQTEDKTRQKVRAKVEAKFSPQVISTFPSTSHPTARTKDAHRRGKNVDLKLLLGKQTLQGEICKKKKKKNSLSKGDGKRVSNALEEEKKEEVTKITCNPKMTVSSSDEKNRHPCAEKKLKSNIFKKVRSQKSGSSLSFVNSEKRKNVFSLRKRGPRKCRDKLKGRHHLDMIGEGNFDRINNAKHVNSSHNSNDKLSVEKTNNREGNEIGIRMGNTYKDYPYKFDTSYKLFKKKKMISKMCKYIENNSIFSKKGRSSLICGERRKKKGLVLPKRGINSLPKNDSSTVCESKDQPYTHRDIKTCKELMMALNRSSVIIFTKGRKKNTRKNTKRGKKA